MENLNANNAETNRAGKMMRTLIMINPVTMPVEVIRYAVLGQGTINPAFYLLSWVITIAVAVFGIMIFNRVEKTFMDTV